jgi:hypothetical protein
LLVASRFTNPIHSHSPDSVIRLPRSATLASLEEGAVVALARAGEHVAFEELVRRRHSYIRALLIRLCRDTTLTDDLVQETFLIAWRELPGLKTLAAFGGSPGKITAAGVQLWGPSGAGVWSSPTVDTKRRRIYVTTGNSHSDPTATTSDAFVAFDLDTGRLVWSQQMTAHDAYTLACDLPESMRANCPSDNGPDFDFASSAMLVNLPRGRRALIAGQKSGVLT